jgi:hypothetical protein
MCNASDLYSIMNDPIRLVQAPVDHQQIKMLGKGCRYRQIKVGAQTYRLRCNIKE